MGKFQGLDSITRDFHQRPILSQGPLINHCHEYVIHDFTNNGTYYLPKYVDTSTTQLCPNKSTIRAYPSCPTIPVYPRSGGGVGSGSWVLLHSRLLLSRTRPRATNCGVKVNIYGLLARHKPPFTHR
ncbi:hypothetical protein HZ326_22484 [Fusarium oxysporum f. sp. albedinis]|nr:hypothetical protein HZ326_22484 [Fusarium oxysporum f. sp. albedinis]